jgi:hypothetical protein
LGETGLVVLGLRRALVNEGLDATHKHLPIDYICTHLQELVEDWEHRELVFVRTVLYITHETLEHFQEEILQI